MCSAPRGTGVRHGGSGWVRPGAGGGAARKTSMLRPPPSARRGPAGYPTRPREKPGRQAVAARGGAPGFTPRLPPGTGGQDGVRSRSHQGRSRTQDASMQYGPPRILARQIPHGRRGLPRRTHKAMPWATHRGARRRNAGHRVPMPTRRAPDPWQPGPAWVQRPAGSGGAVILHRQRAPPGRPTLGEQRGFHKAAASPDRSLRPRHGGRSHPWGATMSMRCGGAAG
jgi:hypothetical protein